MRTEVVTSRTCSLLLVCVHSIFFLLMSVPTVPAIVIHSVFLIFFFFYDSLMDRDCSLWKNHLSGIKNCRLKEGVQFSFVRGSFHSLPRNGCINPCFLSVGECSEQLEVYKNCENRCLHIYLMDEQSSYSVFVLFLLRGLRWAAD